MKMLFITILGLALCTPGTAQNTDMKEGLLYYNKRADGASGLVAKADNIDKAIANFEKAYKSKDAELDAAVMLMKCYYFKGTFVEVEKEKRLVVYNASKALGEKMKAAYPNSAAVVYWHAANMGKWGETSGIMKAAKEGLADLLKEWCEKVIELDPGYKNGAGYRLLGIVHFKTPYIPFVLSWPDNDEALKNLEKALTYDQNDIMANVYYAQVLKDEGEKEKAIAVLEKTVKLQPNPDQLLEDKKELEEANRLLKDYK